MSTDNGSTSQADPDRLAQLLALQERLLLGDEDERARAMRICQSTAVLFGAAGVRLAGGEGAGDAAVVACYGVEAFGADAGDDLRRAAADDRPVLASAGATCRLTVPVRTRDRVLALQILDPRLRPQPADVALARYAAALASVALRHAPATAAPSGLVESDALTILSHDLRQPLGVMLGYTRLLLEDAYGRCTDEQRTIIGTLERHATEMHTLLNSALDLAQHEHQRDDVRLQSFSLPAVLEEICSSSLAHRIADGVQLIWETDASVDCIRSDRFRVRQILQNLVDNALRFTTTGSVTIAASRPDGAIRLEVTDTGRGMAAAEVAALFRPFRDGRPASSSREGRGCGLYLVKRFAESLGGRVTVESTLGAGSRFVVELPDSV